MIKALGKYIRAKLGITELDQRTSNSLSFLSSYMNLMLPAVVVPNDQVLQTARQKMKEKYGFESFNPAIHKNDIMFQHHLRKMPDKPGEALWHYYNVGLDSLSKIRALLQKEPISILDFGSGYGRGARFIPHFFPNARVTVSEVKSGAMDFQKNTFGFHTMQHRVESDSMEGEGYDLIMAISVFSHLPETISQGWIDRLFSFLNEGGCLVFTFNGQRYAPDPNAPYQFITQSEDAGMEWVEDRLGDSSMYGSTYYAEDRIKGLVRDTGVEGRIILDFSGTQDAMVLVK